MAKFTARTTNPTKDNKFYYTDINPWAKKGIGSCTCYAQGRILELENASFGTSKKKYKDTWYPVDMYAKCSEVGGKKITAPVVGCGVVWKSESLPGGHIAIVESVSGDTITFSQWDSKNTFTVNSANKSNKWSWNGYTLVGFFDCQFKWDTTEDYSKNTIPNRFKVKKDGKQIEADTIYSNATATADKVGGVVIDGTTGEQIYTGKTTTTTTKKSLTATSYQNYPAGKYYRVRKSFKDESSSAGSFSVWRNAFSRWNALKSSGYHVYDNSGKQLD